MTLETHSHLTEAISWVAEKWQLIVFIIGAMSGLFWWWMRSMFSTKEHMNACKLEMIHELKEHEAREDKAIKQDRLENRAEHKELRSDLRAIKNHLLGTKYFDE